MNDSPTISNLEQLLDQIGDTASERDRVSLGTVLEAVGSRSFAPLLLVAGLIAIIPGLGDIPGVTTALAVLVLLVAGQMLFRRKHVWLPHWLLKQSVSHDRFRQMSGWLRRPARFVDSFLRPRIPAFAHDLAIAIACLAVAAVMPVMEVVPFGAVAAGVALSAFSLALLAHDGVLALLAFATTGLTIGLAIYNLI